MTSPSSLPHDVSALLREVEDPTVAGLLRALLNRIDAQHSQGLINNPSGPVSQVYGEQHNINTHGGDVADSIDKRIVNQIVVLFNSSNNIHELVTLLAQSGNATTQFVPEFSAALQRARWSEALIAGAAAIAWPTNTLEHAFRAVVPLRAIPKAQSAEERFALIVRELATNTLQRGSDPLVEFVQLLEQEIALPEAKEILHRWLQDAAQSRPVLREQVRQRYAELNAEEPSLLITVNRDQNVLGKYQLRAWLWPDRRQVWPPHGDDEHQSYPMEQIPARLVDLHRAAQQAIAPFADRLRIEFFVPNALLSEPVHEWTVPVTFDDEGEEEEVYPLGFRYRVVMRSYERSFSQRPPSVEARTKWRTKWAQLPVACTMLWHERHHPSDAPCAPIFHPICADDYRQDLFAIFINDDYLCYAETAAPPEEVDYAKKVLLRLVRAGLPIGVWLRDPIARVPAVYQEITALLAAEGLGHLPARVALLRRKLGPQIEPEHALLKSCLVLFYDDPERLPYDPDDIQFESPLRP